MQPTNPLLTPPVASTTIPVIEETARIDKQVVETGRVVVRKTVHHETQTVDVPTQEEQVEVTRVPLNQVVETPPEVRQEGDTMIIPVLREEVVVTTRLVLVEELHVRKRTLTLNNPQEVSLRREEVHYERIETPPPAAAS